jgi:hypothetical protein
MAKLKSKGTSAGEDEIVPVHDGRVAAKMLSAPWACAARVSSTRNTGVSIP